MVLRCRGQKQNSEHTNAKKNVGKKGYKEKKYGFGGKKKGSKMNNK